MAGDTCKRGHNDWYVHTVKGRVRRRCRACYRHVPPRDPNVCWSGHSNWYISPSGKRECRTCRNDTLRAARALNPEPLRLALADWRAANPDLAREYARNWHYANPEAVRIIHARRRARVRNAETLRFTPHDWIRIQNRQRGLCYYCHEPSILTIEHMIPLARGGRHSEGNIVGACLPCNTSKQERTVTEWRHRNPRTEITQRRLSALFAA